MAQKRTEKKHIKHVSRWIHFYELNYVDHSDYVKGTQTSFLKTISKIIDMVRNRDRGRHIRSNDKIIFLQEIRIAPESKEIIGKLRSIRKDVFPELMDTSSDIARGIEAGEDEGVVETSHFIIKYENGIKLGLEYNKEGGKINDLTNYLRVIGHSNQLLQDVTWSPLVKHELLESVAKMNRCSQIQIKVHKDKIKAIQQMDIGLYTALDAVLADVDNDSATFSLKFDYRKKPDTSRATSFVEKFANLFHKSPEAMDAFEMFEVKAENKEKSNILEAFDLLVDKLKSRINVEKNPNYRTVVSIDIFQKIRVEMNNLRIQ